ncbi:nucleolar protein 14-like [Lineus longissimus]|uniref:nucleolar protein 14-like n=1 Tax=Lineus longissimus TaxID=88925 RepID=UPI002B4F00BE
MGKKKRAPMADKVQKKKKVTVKKVNPFEVKVNRQKHSVLGRRVTKHDKGMPGVARSKALKKRQATLLVEYKKRGKANKFIDKRFGEDDPNMTVEDKMLARFALEKQKTHEKPAMFNLNEEEELTHYGQSLSEIEKFNDPETDDEDEEEEGRITASMTGEQHFGGFMTKVEGSERPEVNKSWKERMEEMIAKSKKAKYERQTEKEKSLEMTEKVDSEWKELHMLMAASKKTKEDKEGEKGLDDFDVTVRQLGFEAKGQATDRLKTEDELAQEERERLEKLEEDRLQRMKGFLAEDDEPKTQHRSADDLDDGLYYGDKPKGKKSVQFHLSYKDGKMLTPETEEQSGDEDGSEEGGSGDEGVDEEGSEAGEESEDDEEDKYSDIDVESEDEVSEGEEGVEEESPEGQEKKKGILKKDPKKMLANLKKRKAVMEAARKELPYTFEAPAAYEDLVVLLGDHTVQDQLTIIARLRKCTHPSIAEGNKEKLEQTFEYLLEYFGDLAAHRPPQLELIDKLTVPLYEMSQQFPLKAAEVINDFLSGRRDGFKDMAERRAGRGTFPYLDTLVYFKLVSVLFPTSDLRHPVVTPTMLFMAQILTQSPVSNLRDVSVGLFIINLFLEYVSLSKRLLPEVLTFLHGLLFLAVEKDPKQIEQVFPPFKPVGKNIDLLLLKEKAKKVNVVPFKISETICCTDVRKLDTKEYRVSVISQTLKLIGAYNALYTDLPAWKELFSPIHQMLQKLPIKRYPKAIQDLHSSLVETFSGPGNPRQFLTFAKRKPASIRQMEPKFDEVFDGKKKRGGSRGFKEKQQLLHKHKKEMKGAMREIRKDNQFLAKQKLKEQMELDVERKRKVKEIHSMLANQEGDFQAMKRKKSS